jgi:nucleoid-associated protein YgaU
MRGQNPGVESSVIQQNTGANRFFDTIQPSLKWLQAKFLGRCAVKTYMQNNRKTKGLSCTVAWDRSRQRLHAGAILFAACAFSAGAPALAQDVAEAARQEQARKDKQVKRLKHVYTDEDLSRKHILTREDRELLDAKKREQTAPGAAAPAQDLDAQALEQLPLGDVARILRALKELKSQTEQPAEFHLPFANAVLASPKPEFIAPKPIVVERTTPATPMAPEFPAVEVASPKARPEFVMPRPSTVQPSTNVAPIAPEFPNAAAPRSIIAQRGDSFWKLAQVNLGDGHRWHEIAALNPAILNPNHIVPGTPINILATAPVGPPAPPAPSNSQVTVRKGDSLWKISQLQLGSGLFWGCLAKTNPMIVDPNRIYAGQVLTLPSSCGTSSSR